MPVDISVRESFAAAVVKVATFKARAIRFINAHSELALAALALLTAALWSAIALAMYSHFLSAP